MIPDLGKYAVAVLSAYGASFVLLALLVGLTLRRGRKVRAELDRIEGRGRQDG
ncbi:heme exporter protein CcmD [Sulfitobacter sp. D35]|uniref:heme exporter protein CcmD n=1 Tax=Sulfitobacter sp. D35 TaxID=3083252 RepID=UPI00296E7392|nr:heme exporter protein CcmD [Sulfitobacter sp. D35]MDW4496708.1 heme exporter protein CcmD [Sulfitobacter sp. D35]